MLMRMRVRRALGLEKIISEGAGLIVLLRATLRVCLVGVGLVFVLFSGSSQARTPIVLAKDPQVSPDGEFVVFSYAGDIWRSSWDGGRATRVTSHPADEKFPLISPDGDSVIFVSNRDGYDKVYRKPIEGGVPVVLSAHSESTKPVDWSPDESKVMVEAIRDYPGRRPVRLLQLDTDQEGVEEMLFNGMASDGRWHPDGSQVLFVREGVSVYRKGYYGSQAAQIWIWDKESGEFSQPVAHEYGCRAPRWASDGQSFFYLRGGKRGFSLYQHDLATGEDKVLFESQSGIYDFAKAQRADRFVFSEGFDFWKLEGKGGEPEKLELWHEEDLEIERVVPKVIDRADEIVFSKSGLEILMVVDGGLYAMDTVLKKPINLLGEAEARRISDIALSKDGNTIFFIEDDGVETQICRVTRLTPDVYWWRKPDLRRETLTSGDLARASLTLDPSKQRLAFIEGQGTLRVAALDELKEGVTLDQLELVTVIDTWSKPNYDWSPDGNWMTYEVSDENFNNDVWITKVDGDFEPRNISLHPDYDGRPKWSPDGTMIAFLGNRFYNQQDLFCVKLRLEDATEAELDRLLAKADKAMAKDPAYAKKKGAKGKESENKKKEPEESGADEPDDEKDQEQANDQKDESANDEELEIDFAGIHERVEKLSLSGKRIANYEWSADSKSLIFNEAGSDRISSIGIEKGAKIKTLVDAGVRLGRVDKGEVFYGSYQGKPAKVEKKKRASYAFKVHKSVDIEEHQAMLFRMAWRVMRDRFYDEAMNGLDWREVFARYEQAASTAPTVRSFLRVANMMVGELNASHLGVSLRSSWRSQWSPSVQWRPQTNHLGVRFERLQTGGWRVSEVIPKGPADREQSRLSVGDVVKTIDEVNLSFELPLTEVLNDRTGKLYRLLVTREDGSEEEVLIESISYSDARNLGKDAVIAWNESQVAELSGGSFGYIHIERMRWDSFQEFQRRLASQGIGKDGLVIDVRNNGGGSTTDHLLTSLCQPRHAFTIAREGERGYPDSRSIYATWSKPIVVLCNQNSFSNAEIFSHAIRTLDRGKVVGVPTAGGVISTGSATLLGNVNIRVPFRGWFTLNDGEDMELNGAMPHHVVWNQPGELSNEVDRQLEKAVEVLKVEVEKAKSLPMVAPIYRNRPAGD